MTAVEILEKIKGYVESSVNLGYGAGNPQYKNMVVPWFSEAWENGYTEANSNPRLTGDAMVDQLEGQLGDQAEGWFNKYGDDFRRFCDFWDEWMFLMRHWNR